MTPTITRGTLGQHIRALRLGYRPFDNRYYMRLIKEGEKYRIELSSFLDVPKHKTRSGEHLCWWDGGDEIVMAIPCLRPIKAVHKPISFLITSTGEYAGT